MSEEAKTQPPAKVDEPEDPNSENLSSPVTKIQELFASFSRVGPVPHPIYEKIEPEHVTQILANAHEAQQQEWNFRRSGRWFYLIYLAAAVVVFLFLTVTLLPDHAETYFELLKGIAIFAAGVGGGYGLKAYRG